MSEPFLCRDLSDPTAVRYVLGRCRDFFSMTSVERTVYLSVGTFDLVIAIFNLIVLITVRALREPPSDILLILTIFAIVKTLLIFITIIYDDLFPPYSNPSNFNSFCWSTGFIEVAARSAKTIYTLILTFLYAHKVKNPLKAWVTPTKEIHCVCLFLILLITIPMYFTSAIGITIYGYCGVTFSMFSTYFLAISDLFYLLALISASVYFLRNVKNISNNNSVIKEFFRYYLYFLIVICVDQAIVVFGEFIVAVSCDQQKNFQLFQGSKILVNVSSCSISLFALFIICCNPQFRRIMSLKLVSGLYNRYKKWLKKLREQPQDYDIRPSFYEELLTTNRKTILFQLTTLANLDQGYLIDLKDKSRACFLSSVLGCLSLQHFQIKKHVYSSDSFRTSAVQQDQNSLFSWNYNQNYSFTLTGPIVDHYQRIFTKKLPPVLIKFTSYSPNVLYCFAQMNAQTDLWKSLSPCNNQKAIAKDCGGGQGGSSGQFFFFNHNKTLILKTISSKQRNVFLERLEHFHKHFLANPHSLIVKIYSIASVNNIESGDEVSFSLMGNILKGINKQAVIRSYDLKGSLHSREVLKGRKVKNQQRVSQTLKDIDFDKLQEKIWIESQQSDKLKRIIKADSKFLCEHGLIDYSLLVLKLDIEALKDSAEEMKTLKTIPHYKCAKDQKVVYIFGIIDYLQTWNLRKKGEKWYKSIFTKKDTISSQNPQFYSDRFVSFAERILAC